MNWAVDGMAIVNDALLDVRAGQVRSLQHAHIKVVDWATLWMDICIG